MPIRYSNHTCQSHCWQAVLTTGRYFLLNHWKWMLPWHLEAGIYDAGFRRRALRRVSMGFNQLCSPQFFWNYMKAFWLIGSNQKLKNLLTQSNLENPDVWLNLLLIDLQKAFDLINHNVLVEKLLKEFHVNPNLVRIMVSFLPSRTQYVKYKNIYSDLLPVYTDVPQGTLLSLLLFLIMINRLFTEYPDCWKFVDDMFLLGKGWKNLKSSAMEIMEDISSDALQADMTVNAKKSNIKTISFLNSTPLFKQPIPSGDVCPAVQSPWYHYLEQSEGGGPLY